MQKYVQEFLFVIVHSKGWYLKYLLVRRCNQIKSIVFPFFCSMDTFQRESHGSFQLRVPAKGGPGAAAGGVMKGYTVNTLQ